MCFPHEILFAALFCAYDMWKLVQHQNLREQPATVQLNHYHYLHLNQVYRTLTACCCGILLDTIIQSTPLTMLLVGLSTLCFLIYLLFFLAIFILFTYYSQKLFPNITKINS